MLSSGARRTRKIKPPMGFKLPCSPRESNRIRRLLSVVARCGCRCPPRRMTSGSSPRVFRPAVGGKVPLRLLVGQDFAGATTVYLPETFERYDTTGPDGKKPVVGVPATTRRDSSRSRAPARTVVAYRSTLFTVTFDTLAEFEQYLERKASNAHQNAAHLWPAQGQVIREDYSRSAKALVMAGKPGTSADRVLGLRLELVAEKSVPHGTRAAAVNLRGQTPGDALPGGLQQNRTVKKRKARTDKDGRVQFDFNRPGVWLVATRCTCYRRRRKPMPTGSRSGPRSRLNGHDTE